MKEHFREIISFAIQHQKKMSTDRKAIQTFRSYRINLRPFKGHNLIEMPFDAEGKLSSILEYFGREKRILLYIFRRLLTFILQNYFVTFTALLE